MANKWTTIKPFSTICWNTNDFLKANLERAVKEEKINFWCYVEHKAEGLEKKDHKHVYIEPNGQLELNGFIKDYLTEFDPNNPTKPIKPRDIRKSKFMDWYLYGLHDIKYLRKKGEVKQFHYAFEDIISSDVEVLSNMVVSPYDEDERIKEEINSAIMQGYSWNEIVRAIDFKIANILHWKEYYRAVIELFSKKPKPKNQTIGTNIELNCDVFDTKYQVDDNGEVVEQIKI